MLFPSSGKPWWADPDWSGAERPKSGPAKPSPAPTLIFFNVVRTGRAGKRRAHPNPRYHIRRKHTNSRKLSSRQQTKKRKVLLENSAWVWQDFIMAEIRSGGNWIQFRRLFASGFHRWDKFSPYLERLSNYLAHAFRQDRNSGPLTNARLLLPRGQPVKSFRPATFKPAITPTKIATTSERMEVETDPVVTQAGLQRWANRLADEKKRLQTLLDEKEAEISRLTRTYSPTNKTELLDGDETPRAPSPSDDSGLAEETCQPGSPPSSEAPVDSTSRERPSTGPRHAFVSDESEDDSEPDAPPPRSSPENPTVEITDAAEEEDVNDQYFLEVERMFGREFARIVREKASRAGS